MNWKEIRCRLTGKQYEPEVIANVSKVTKDKIFVDKSEVSKDETPVGQLMARMVSLIVMDSLLKTMDETVGDLKRKRGRKIKKR